MERTQFLVSTHLFLLNENKILFLNIGYKTPAFKQKSPEGALYTKKKHSN